MQIITKGYFWLSLILIVIGFVIGRTLALVMFPETMAWIKDSGYGLYFGVFGLGIPFAVVDILECKYIWAKVLKREKIDLLGVSVGFALGGASLLFI